MKSGAFAETVPHLLQMRAQSSPDRIGCRYLDDNGSWVSIQWSELWREVQRISRAFRHLGLKPGQRLAIMSRTCLEWQIAEMAALAAGAIVVGIDAHGTPESINHILHSSRAWALVIDETASLEKLSHETQRQLQFVVALGGDAVEAEDLEIVMWPQLRDLCQETHNELQLPSSNAPATLIYTSGTTGQPKEIGYSHRQLMAACTAIAEEFHQLGRGDSAICWLPMSALFQRMMNLVAVARGITTYFVDNPREIMTRIGEIQPSLFVGVPRFYEKLHEGIRRKLEASSNWKRRVFHAALDSGRRQMELASEGGRTPPQGIRGAILDRLVLRKIRRVMGDNMRFMITGSAPTPRWMLEFFHGVGLPLLEAYGVSENTVPMAANRPDCYRLGSVGKPFSVNEIDFAEDGEVLVRGPGVFDGYNGDALNADCFTPEGFYKTGDIGRLDGEGFLYLTGRKSEFIKTSTGRRISPVAVENVLNQSLLFEHVVVVGNGRKFLAAVITLAADHKVDADVSRQVKAELARLNHKLATHEQIHQFAILPDSLSIEGGELTSTLKIRRRFIEDKYCDLIERLYSEGAARPHVHDSTVTSELAQVS